MVNKIFRLLVFYHIFMFCIGCAHCNKVKKNTTCPVRPQMDFPQVTLALKTDQKIHQIVSPDSHLMVPHVHSGPRSRELIFDCNATYPIEWVFVAPKNSDRQIHVESSRSIPVSSQPWHNVYSAKLKITTTQKHVKETNQTCRSVSDRSCLQTTVITKRTGPTNNQTWAIAITSNSPSGVTLVDYDSLNGINWDCSISLTYDPSEKQFCCVSKLSAEANISFIDRNCIDPVDCRQLYSDNKCQKKLTSYATCPPDNSLSFSPPSAENEFQSAGVIICHEEGKPEQVSDVIHYFYSLPKLCNEDSNRLPSPYFNWHDARLFEFVSMCQRKEPIYLGEKINFTCTASVYYTTAGMQFGIERTSEDNLPHDETILGKDYVTQYETLDQQRGFRNMSREIFINDTNIKAIICMAPQRYSKDWIRKEVHLSVLVPTEISFDQSEGTEIKYRPDLVLRCQVHGRPTPTLTWVKGGDELSESLNISIVSNAPLGWTELHFPNFEDPTPLLGYYTCRAKNQLKQHEKVFVVMKNAVTEESTRVSQDSTNNYIMTIVLPLIILVVVFVFIFLVWKIVQQTRKLRKLTHAEIEEFMNGRPDIVKNYKESNYEINSYANCLPYNKKYEILKDQLEIDENAILGTGAYGMVLKGTLTTRMKTKVKVAIKTVKPMDDITYFKALLSELKIMAFIGKHVNIINLIGAYTSNIEQREIYIATEYCDNGNVLSFLKRNRRTFTNLVENGELTVETSFAYTSNRISYGSTGSNNSLSTINILRWSAQIAAGMDFLGTKKVIHGDLAARNVFISADLIVKIGDFGLSKQLFEYANYIKKNQSPLPWKWLAIECLQDMQFSVKSDIWAYGITLWEMYSLGQTPYQGCVYNEEFITRLVGGMRPTAPQCASKKIYDQMLTCWEKDTSVRPTFKDMKMFFDNQLEIIMPKEYMDLEERDPLPITTVTIENSR